ncbi:glycine zipper 2TM domain-containing protein [Kordiimonas pumila]|uniref:17 kDa surface antigen n=1 Tax=Kordiimonas pumila TaxID=2161677 RepID=A0ABV7D1D9_9PROT|nr:glycine zipper 2TM domain-containing protein [Kordiimonas pumila]
MFKIPLMLLATTAILLPAEYAAAGDTRERHPRAVRERPAREPAQRQQQARQQQAPQKVEAPRAAVQPRQAARQAPQRVEAPRAAVQQQHPRAVSARAPAYSQRPASVPQSVSKSVPVQNTRQVRSSGKPALVTPASRENTRSVTRTNARTETRVSEPVRQRPNNQNRTVTSTRTREVTHTNRVPVKAQPVHPRSVHASSNGGYSYTSGYNRAPDRSHDGNRYDDHNHNRQPTRHAQPYYNGNGKYHGHRRYRSDIDIYFGFGNYYGWPSSSFAYHRGYWDGYYYSNWYDYYGHWPYRSGYYGVRSAWLWSHYHHHYHYGDYCPNDYNQTTVYYEGSPSSYSSSSGGAQIAGLILGGVIGGVIGAEIDGGHNKTAGTVIGAALGAAVGVAATTPDTVTYREPEGVTYKQPAGVAYEGNGQHPYEAETYQPPEEVRTCIRYENRDGTYVCNKWTVEYYSE